MAFENKKSKHIFNTSAQSACDADVRIETPRLLLREFKSNDAQKLHEIINAPGFSYYCFDGSLSSVERFLQDAKDTKKPMPDGTRKEYMLAVVLKETGDLIGHVALQRVDHVKGFEFDANFFIDPAHQSKGYGRECLINIKNFGYDKLGHPGYTITVHPDNSPSLKVFLSEGYSIIGQTTIDTINGKEPRLLLFQDKAGFYARRKLDKNPLLLNAKKISTAANENKTGYKK